MRIQNLAAALGLGLALITALVPALPSAAQDKPNPQSAPAAQPQYPVPPAEQLVLLIRLSLLTLNDAVQTGNYSVLRDRGGPSFRQTNSAARLARIFTNLEAQGLDLAPVATLMPQLSEAKIAGPEQLLHVKGHFPTRPAQISFDLMYEPAEGHWKLFGLSVGAVPVEQAAAPAAEAKTTESAKKETASGKPAKDKATAKKK